MGTLQHAQRKGHIVAQRQLSGITGKENANMQARGPLMIEHRLIERMLSVIKGVIENRIETQGGSRIRGYSG